MSKKKVNKLEKGDIVDSEKFGPVTIFERRDGKGPKGRTDFQIIIHEREANKVVVWSFGWGDNEVDLIDTEGEEGDEKRMREMFAGGL